MSRFDGSAFRLDSKEILATNGLLRDEMLGFFRKMFAGEELEPIPTPAEFAAQRTAAHTRE
jgi:myo-inositol-1(or 4)-monophosphatase